MEHRIRKFNSATQKVKEGPAASGLWVGKDGNDDWQLKFNPNGTVKTVAHTGNVLRSAEVTFTETGGALTYTGGVDIPAGATLVDVIVYGAALWDNSGAVTMIVGDPDDDPDGYYTGVNLKATDLLAGESLSFAIAGGKQGAYYSGTNTHVENRYSAAARTITGVVTTASTGGSAGRTRMTVIWSEPSADNITAATSA